MQNDHIDNWLFRVMYVGTQTSYCLNQIRIKFHVRVNILSDSKAWSGDGRRGEANVKWWHVPFWWCKHEAQKLGRPYYNITLPLLLKLLHEHFSFKKEKKKNNPTTKKKKMASALVL